jgi:hypothetical protein
MSDEVERVDAGEAIGLSERAWGAWERRRLAYFAVPAVLLIPAAILAVTREDAGEGSSDWQGIAMLVLFGLAFAAILWVRWQMPLSPPRVRTLADQGLLTPRHVERLRRQAAA